MTQYDKRVEKQRLMIKAKKWQNGINSLHAHALNSMAYAEGRIDGSVMDITYNDGLIKREIQDTGEVVYFGKRLTGDELLDDFSKFEK